MKPFEIFRPGRHTAMNGEALDFSEAKVADTAAAYDPALHEAPIVVGHPKDDGPAYGWVGGLEFVDGVLTATPRDVDPAFAEMVKAGRYRKVSAAFYRPGAANNPTPGHFALRHVAFLGAQPPAVKGLKPVTFADADADADVVVFGDFTDRVAARLFRRLRDFIIDKFDLETADEVLPAWDVDLVQEDAAQPEASTSASAFAETDHDLKGNDAMDKQELDAREEALKEREDKIKAFETEFAEKQTTQNSEATAIAGREAAAALDRLIGDGRFPPGHRDAMAAFMGRLDDGDSLTFAEPEDGAKIEGSMRGYMTAFLESLPKSISFGEHSNEDGDSVDPGDAQALANAGLAYQEKMRRDGIEVSIDVAVRKAADASAA